MKSMTEIGSERQQHHVAHVARPGRADEDTVHLERQHAAHRGEGGPRNERDRRRPDVLGRGDDRHQLATKQQEDDGGEAGEDKAPDGGDANGPGEGTLAAGADGAAGQLLDGAGEAVEEIAADQEEVHQDGVGRQRQRAELGALRA